MDFAADAVFEMPPQPRAAAPARAEAPDSESFSEHLEAAREDADGPPRSSGRAAKKSPAEESSDTQPSITNAQAAQPPPAPISISLLGTMNEAEAQDVDAITPSPLIPAAPADAAPIPAKGALNPDAKSATTPPSPESLTPEVVAEDAPISATPQPSAPPADAASVQSDIVGADRGQGVAPGTPQAIPLAMLQSIMAAQAPGSAPAPLKQHNTRIAEAPLQTGKAQTKPDPEKAPPAPSASAFNAALKNAQSIAENTVKPSAAPLFSDRGDSNSLSAQPATGAPLAVQAATTAEPISTSHAHARALPAASQVAREIVRRFDGDSTHFELRLDPPELGRVEVRLEVSRDHRVTAVVTADNPQALADLARHARELEQMLQSAGLQLSDNGLSFDLRQGGDRSDNARTDGGGGDNGEDATPSEAPLTARPLGFERWRGVRVDISV